MDFELLRAINTIDAHTASWGETARLALFLSSIFRSRSGDTQLEKPSGKSFQDRFKKFVSDKHVAYRRNPASSGILKIFKERAQLLYNMIQKLYEKA